MARAVGHLDKRTRVFRCQACARRRMKVGQALSQTIHVAFGWLETDPKPMFKCDGRRPCSTCFRLQKSCIPQQQGKSHNVTFVAFAPDSNKSEKVSSDVPAAIHPPLNTQFRNHFMTFLANCHFTENFGALTPDILRLLQSPGFLLDISLAVGALEISRKGSCRSLTQQHDAAQAALRLYSRSIRAFSLEISSSGFQPGEEALWTTFLLGLFELMSKVSSTDSWSMHMIQGMGQVVRYMPIEAKSTQLTKELLEVYRCLEISRAILYGSDTTLQPGPASDSSPASSRSSLAMSQELMLEASLLSHQMFREIQNPSTDDHSTSSAKLWAHKGADFLNKLRASLLHLNKSPSSDDSFQKLAIINCCALHLYLCRNFSYYSCFDGLQTPRLAEDESEELINTVLNEIDGLYTKSEIPGILLLFPLRVTGASARTTLHKARVKHALERVYTRGYMVSRWIVTDLQELWDWEETFSKSIDVAQTT